MTAVLHADVVLVGVEVGHAVIGDRVTEHVARRRRTLVEGGGPVLDAQPPERGITHAGDIAGGEDALQRGLQELVAHDPVADRDAGRGGRRDVRRRAHADHHEVAVDRAPVRGPDPLDRGRALEALDAGAEQHLHAPVGVDVAVDRSRLGAERVLERHRRRGDHRHLQAHLARRRRHLAADPARADDHQAAAAAEPLTQPIGLRQAAQVVDLLQLGSGNREPAGLCAGRQQQPVIAQPLTAAEHDLGRPRLDALDGRGGAQLDRPIRVEGLVVDIDLVEPGLAAQIVLRQRWALVRALRLGADQHDASVEALLAQLGGRRGAGQARADDDEGLLAHVSPASFAPQVLRSSATLEPAWTAPQP